MTNVQHKLTFRWPACAVSGGRTICLWMCCLAAVCLAQAADPNSPVGQDENDMLIAEMPSTAAQRELWKVRASASEPDTMNVTKSQLQELIKKVGAIQFDDIKPVDNPPVQETHPQPPVKLGPQPVVVVEPVNVVEPNTVRVESAAATVETKTKAERPKGYVSNETLAIFQQMLANPKTLKNPLELAEILYRSECFKEAGVCYQTALDRMKADDEDPYENRSWALYQLGNCLAKDDPLAAMNKFQAVIKEYPNCPWAELARTKVKVIDWQLKDKPAALISEYKKQ